MTTFVPVIGKLASTTSQGSLRKPSYPPTYVRLSLIRVDSSSLRTARMWLAVFWSGGKVNNSGFGSLLYPKLTAPK